MAEYEFFHHLSQHNNGAVCLVQTNHPVSWWHSRLASLEHIVHIDGVVGSSPTVTTKAEAVENQRLLLFIPSPWGALPRGVLRRYEHFG